jgi:integrase
MKMIRALACTGCRRGEIINLKWTEVDAERSCLRLIDSKEGASTRPMGLSVIDALEAMRPKDASPYVFRGTQSGKQLIGFPKYWNGTFKNTEFAKITPSPSTT